MASVAAFAVACGELDSPELAAEATRQTDQALSQDPPVSEEAELAMMEVARREAELESAQRVGEQVEQVSEPEQEVADGSGTICTADSQSAPFADESARPSIEETDRFHRRDESIATLLLDTGGEEQRPGNLDELRNSLEMLDARRGSFLPGQHALSPERTGEWAGSDSDQQLQQARLKLEQQTARAGEER